VAHSAKLEKAKAEEVAEKLGRVYAVQFSVIEVIKILLQKKSKFLR